MNNFLIPHPPASVEQMRQAVIDWRAAAAHERFRIKHNLCCGSAATAYHNAALYEQMAADIEKEIHAASADPTNKESLSVAEPVAWVAADTLNSPHPGCVSSLAYMSQLDREQGRKFVPLYDATVAANAEALLDALRQIAEWPDGGNLYGQEKIKRLAQQAIDKVRRAEGES